MTFSVAGRCAEAGMFGVAITTSSICIGSRCPWVRAGVGAVSTQNVTLPSIGPMVLDRLQAGDAAPKALDGVMVSQRNAQYRQVIAIDGDGQTAWFSGDKILGTHAISQGKDCIAAGNLLKSDELPSAMTRAFEQQRGQHLATRLLSALEAGLYDAGGEEGAVHSAALLVADAQSWPLVDLRVDWDDADPVRQLRKLWDDFQPQMADYVTRALDPASAPAYGVPGDA